MQVTARSAAEILDIDPNSAAMYYRKIREVISYYLEKEAEIYVGGEIEVDESYFCGHRKANRGSGATGIFVISVFIRILKASPVGEPDAVADITVIARNRRTHRATLKNTIRTNILYICAVARTKRD